MQRFFILGLFKIWNTDLLNFLIVASDYFDGQTIVFNYVLLINISFFFLEKEP